MPSIESLYQEKEKTVDKCTVKSPVGLSSDGSDIAVGSDIVEVRVQKLEEKMVSLKEAVEIDESEASTTDLDSLVVVKIGDSGKVCGEEDDETSSVEKQEEKEETEEKHPCEDEEKFHKDPEDLNDQKDTSKPHVEKWDSIIGKICPDFSQAKNKLLKSKMSALLAKALSKGDDLCNRMGGMSLAGDKNGLTSRGPGQATFQQAEMSPQYSPAYLHSPGQLMSSPPHETSVIPGSLLIQDMKGGSSIPEVYPWVSNFHPVSPPNHSYQSEHSTSDADFSHASPQSPDDGPQDIPTIMAQAMHLIVPGEYQPTPSNQEVVNQWNSPSMTSQVSGMNLPIGRTDYQEQSWPGVESPSPASFHGNPPSVSSISDVDSVFGSPSPYNTTAMSPASGSGGSAVQSPAPTPPSSTQWLPPQTSTAVPAGEFMTITSSSNINFGLVQVQKGPKSCSSPSQLSSEQRIKNIEDYLKMSDMEPPPQPQQQQQQQQQYHQQQQQQQQQTTLPPIDSILHTQYHGKAPSGVGMRPPSNPYSRPGNAQSPKASGAMRNSQRSPQPSPVMVTNMQLPYSPQVETASYEGKSAGHYSPYPPQYHHKQNAMRLSPEELQQRDCSDPYEGENLLQKLILHQMSEEAIAVIERMVCLGLDLDTTNDQGQSSLLLAVINDMPRVVSYLVHCNADVLRGDKKGTNPIHYAASHGFTEVIKAMCYSNRHINLDDHDFNGKTPLMCAVEAHGTYQTIYQAGDEVTKLVNNEIVVKMLIDCGAQPTKQDLCSGKTALHYAIADVKLDMIKFILEGDEMVKVARIPMYDGNTPLHLAVALKCDQNIKCDIIQYLVSKGADISATNGEREKPLVLVTDGHTQVKECLEQYSKTRRR